MAFSRTFWKIVISSIICGAIGTVGLLGRHHFATAIQESTPVAVHNFGSDYKLGRPLAHFLGNDREPATAKPTPIPAVPPEYVQYRDKVIVLVYHHIAPSEAGEEITITPERFELQMEALKDNHYQVISMEDYIYFLKYDRPVPSNAVVITFDDGYESFYTYAYPILKKLGFTATNFIVVSYVDSYYPRLPFLTWKEIQQMHKDGFSFYSHTFDLHRRGLNDKKESVPALTNRLLLEGENRLETEEEYEARVRDDLLKAKTIIHEKLNTDFPLLCFPYGAYNQTAIDIARNLGIQYFFTVKEGINGETNKEILRINAGTRYVSAEKLIKRLNGFHDQTTQVTNAK